MRRTFVMPGWVAVASIALFSAGGSVIFTTSQATTRQEAEIAELKSDQKADKIDLEKKIDELFERTRDRFTRSNADELHEKIRAEKERIDDRLHLLEMQLIRMHRNANGAE